MVTPLLLSVYLDCLNVHEGSSRNERKCTLQKIGMVSISEVSPHQPVTYLSSVSFEVPGGIRHQFE